MQCRNGRRGSAVENSVMSGGSRTPQKPHLPNQRDLHMGFNQNMGLKRVSNKALSIFIFAYK